MTKSDLEHNPRLTMLHKWERGYHHSQLEIEGDLIITADSMRSLEVLRWSSKTKLLHLVARDHGSVWPVAMTMLNKREVLVAEVGNSVLSVIMWQSHLSSLTIAGAWPNTLVHFEGRVS
jgi:hypothetical protein